MRQKSEAADGRRKFYASTIYLNNNNDNKIVIN